jgi:hypothetical protein
MADHHTIAPLIVAAPNTRVLCTERAAYCRCTKDAGHEQTGDLVHACDPAMCTGKWTGSFDNARFDGGSGWEPVEQPKRIGPWRPPHVTVTTIVRGQTNQEDR